MYRIALSRLLLVVRLAILASLVGYNISSASAAMHGSAFPEFENAVSVATPEAGDHHTVEASDHDHQHDASTDDGGTKLVKQECCKDFCGGLGIICEGPDVGGPVVTSIRQFIDDRAALGELPSLHRPPNI
ncbi:hypothetical protein FHT82_000732 [Rhizobium sp. BK275]|nr:hypothetical protein [Rhizobium sp. BK275]MBB3407361.1 hypothetical protein [Rhizobium sp. BK316]